MTRYGVLGGSFDPPHYGHLALAETARIQLKLERVLFVPAGQPPHKQQNQLSLPEERAAMVKAAIADNGAFLLDRTDLDRPGPHYTTELLALLQSSHPTVTEWYFLMGEDSLRDLPTWHQPESLLERARLAVMPRPDMQADWPALELRFPELTDRIVWLDVPPVNFAATDLRRRVREGLPLRYLVPPGVETYIRQEGLYR